jgi:hypothetical protein
LKEPTSTGGTEMQERKRLEDIIKELPEDLRKELEDFAHYLWERKFRQGHKRKKLLLTWAGGLKEYRDRFTSLELQKKALEWWTNEVFS